MSWISVRNWRRFQHYDPAKRVPPWIKAYTDLMDNADYLELTEHQALLLHRLWLTYASASCQVRLNTATLSRQLGLRVMTRDIEALNHAGFIDIVASKALAEGYHAASASRAREETETEEEPKAVTSTQDATPPEPATNGLGSHEEEDDEQRAADQARAWELVEKTAATLRSP